MMKYLTPIFFISCLLYLVIEFALSISEPEKNIKTENKNILKPTDQIMVYFTAYVTIYHPTLKECGSDKNKTASGRQGELGICACSQFLFDYYVNYGDTIEVIGGSLKGKYIVADKAGSKGKVIDIWRPVGDTVKGCYKTKFKVHKVKS